MFDFNEVFDSPEYQNATPEAQLEVEALLAENFWTELTSDPSWVEKTPEEQKEYRKAFDQRFRPGLEVRLKLEGDGRSTLDVAKDTGIALTKGVVNAGAGVVGIADIATGGRVGKFMNDKTGYDPKATNQFLDEKYSEEQQLANQNVEQAEGFGGKVKALAQNPSAAGILTLESVPSMVGGAGIGQGIRKVAGAGGILAAGAGEGAISAGSMAEQIRQENPDELLTPGQAAMSAGSGVLTGALGVVGGRLAQKMGFTDIDSYLVTVGDEAVKATGAKGVVNRIIGGGITEGAFEEMPQSMQEQVWQNAATGKPLMQGVPEAGGEGAVLGGIMGAGANLLPSKPTPKDIIDAPDIDTAIDTFTESVKSIDTKIAGIDERVKGSPVDFGILSSPVDPITGQAIIQGKTDDTIRAAGNNLVQEGPAQGSVGIEGVPEGGGGSERQVNTDAGVSNPRTEGGIESSARRDYQIQNGTTATAGDAGGVLGKGNALEVPEYTESAINDALYDFSDQAQDEQDQADARKRKNDFVNMRDEDQAITELNRRNQPEVEPDPQLSAPIQKTTPLSRIKKDYGVDVYNEVKAARGNGEAISVEEAINRVVKKQGGDVFADTQGEQNGDTRPNDSAVVRRSEESGAAAGLGNTEGGADQEAGIRGGTAEVQPVEAGPQNPPQIPQSAQYLGKSLGEHLYKDTDGTLYRSEEAPAEKAAVAPQQIETSQVVSQNSEDMSRKITSAAKDEQNFSKKRKFSAAGGPDVESLSEKGKSNAASIAMEWQGYDPTHSDRLLALESFSSSVGDGFVPTIGKDQGLTNKQSASLLAITGVISDKKISDKIMSLVYAGEIDEANKLRKEHSIIYDARGDGDFSPKYTIGDKGRKLIQSLQSVEAEISAARRRPQELNNTPSASVPDTRTEGVTSIPATADTYEESQANLESVRPSIQSGKDIKTAPNVVLMNVRTKKGENPTKISAPHNGTEEDALRVAKALRLYAAEEYDASMQQSETFGTDDKGSPQYAFTQGQGVTEVVRLDDSGKSAPSDKSATPIKQAWQMNRAEFRESVNTPKVAAIKKAISAGQRISVNTQLKSIPLSKPDHIRIAKDGGVAVPQGAKWVSLADDQVDLLATQAGMEVPGFNEKTYHREEVKKAREEGKPVPEEVLSEYPDLFETEEDNIITGATGTAETESGREISFQWVIAESDDVIASNDKDTMEVNPDYPAELQPRNRENAAYKLQVAKISNNLKPARLGSSQMVGDGAPIVGPDMAVESGNGRTIAIKQAYGSGKANGYKEWIAKHAEEFGLTSDQVNGMASPILVRVRQTEMTTKERVAFASEANESAVTAMSAVEQASVDARKLESLDDFYPSESGEFDNASNRGFIKRFISAIIAASEQNGMYTADGSALSQEGKTRIRNAVFAKAYGADAKVLSRVVESTDNNIRNITNGMLIAAPKIAKMKMDIAAGKLYALDNSEEIARAVEDLASILAEGKTVDNELAQLGLFGDNRTEAHKALLRFLEENKRSGKKIALFLTEYVGNVYAAGNPKQMGMFGEKRAATIQEVIAKAVSTVEESKNVGKQAEIPWNTGTERSDKRPADIQDNDGLDTSSGEGRAKKGQESAQAGVAPEEVGKPGPLPEYAKKAGIATWKQAQRKGVASLISQAKGYADEIVKHNVTMTRGNPESVANKIAEEIIQRTVISGGLDSTLQGLAVQYWQKAKSNGSDPSGDQHYTAIARGIEALRARLKNLGKTKEVGSLNSGSILDISQGKAENKVEGAVFTTQGEGEENVLRQTPGISIFINSSAQTRAESLLASVTHDRVGEFRTKTKRIRTAKEVAEVVGPRIAGEAQENIFVVATTEDGSPLAILQHSYGKKSSAVLEYDSVIGFVHNTEGAERFWVIHNHPVKNPKLSDADKSVSNALFSLTSGTGIEFNGLMAIDVEGNYEYSFSGDDNQTPSGYYLFDKDIPLVRRVLSKYDTENIVNGDNADIAVPEMLEPFGNTNGVLMFDNQGGPLGFVSLSEDETLQLRSGRKGTGASKILSAIEASNATFYAVSTHSPANTLANGNITSFLTLHGGNVFRNYRDGQKIPLTSGDIGSGSTFFSREAGGVFTQAEVEKELSAHLGANGMQNLLATGTVRILNTQDQARKIIDRLKTRNVKHSIRYSKNGAIQGFTTASKVYLVRDGIAKGKSFAVLKHELGAHLGQATLNNAEFQALLKSIEARKDEQSKTGDAIRAAMARVPKSTNPEHYWEEVLAYAVEQSPEVGIGRRFIALIKRMLVKLGISPKIFTAADLAALAEAAVRRETRSVENEKQRDTKRTAEKTNSGNSRLLRASISPDGEAGRDNARGMRRDVEGIEGVAPEEVRGLSDDEPMFSVQAAEAYDTDMQESAEEEPNAPIIADAAGTFSTGTYDDPAMIAQIKPGVQVELIREPENEADSDAIRIELNGKKVGYVSKIKSPQLTDLMDDRVDLTAKIRTVANPERPVFTIEIAKPEGMTDMQERSWADARDIIGRHKDGWSFKRIAEKAEVDPEEDYTDDIEAAAREVLEKSKPEKNWVKKIVKFVSGLKHDKLNHLFSVLTLQQLDDIYGRDFTPVKDFRKAAKGISAMTNELLQEADRLHQKWSSLNPKVAADMADVMFKATTLGFDPDVDTDIQTLKDTLEEKRVALKAARQAKLTGEQKAKIVRKLIKEVGAAKKDLAGAEDLIPAFNALPEEAKEVYREVRKIYQDRFGLLQEVLIEQIEKSGIGKGKRSTIAALKLEFDKQMKSGPYFPLSRFGDHIVIAKKLDSEGNEVDRMVKAFERFANAEEFSVGMRAKGFDVTLRRAKDYKPGQQPPHEFASEVLKIVNSADMDSQERRQIMDEINQAMIKVLPDLSYRKHFAHRKGVKGYSQDAQRAFASHMLHSAKHIAKVKYGTDLNTAIKAMENSKFAHDEKSAAVEGALRNELVKRFEFIMNANVHPAAQILTSLGFAWNIGPSLASAVVNLTQTPLVAYPLMGARFGFAKSARALTRAARDYTRGDLSWESGMSLEKAKFLNEQERKMFAELIKDGTIDVSQAHDLAAAAATDYLSLAEKGGNLHKYAKVMKLVSAPFHYAEVANRQITALAAYRVAVVEVGHDAAVDLARKVVEEGHFDYGQENRARVMQGNVARVALLFKQYAQNMSYRLVRDFVVALKKSDVTPAEKRQAKLQFAGILGGHFMVAGTLGLPVVGMLGTALNMMVGALGDDDEPWDWKAEFRNWLADRVGLKGGEMIAHGPTRGLLPVDVAGRLSLADLWWRGDDRDLEGRELFNHYMMNIAGPTASNAASVFMGMASIADGDIWKGVEMMVPKFVKDVAKSIRYANEGVTNRQQDVLLGDLEAMELTGQLLGFTPARVAEMYEGKSAVKKIEYGLQNRRTRLKNRYLRAKESGDRKKMAEAWKPIQRWNSAHADVKALRITKKDLDRTEKTRQRYRKGTKKGIWVPKTREYLRDEGRFANVE